MRVSPTLAAPLSSTRAHCSHSGGTQFVCSSRSVQSQGTRNTTLYNSDLNQLAPQFATLLFATLDSALFIKNPLFPRGFNHQCNIVTNPTTTRQHFNIFHLHNCLHNIFILVFLTTAFNCMVSTRLLFCHLFFASVLDSIASIF